jgi:hypothetical protein
MIILTTKRVILQEMLVLIGLISRYQGWPDVHNDPMGLEEEVNLT